MSVAEWISLSRLSFVDARAALAALKERRGGEAVQAASLEEAAALWNLTLVGNADGSFRLQSRDGGLGDEEDFLKCLAPHLTDDSTVEVCMEDGEGPGTFVKLYRVSGGTVSVQWEYETEVDGVPVREGHDEEAGERFSEGGAEAPEAPAGPSGAGPVADAVRKRFPPSQSEKLIAFAALAAPAEHPFMPKKKVSVVVAKLCESGTVRLIYCDKALKELSLSEYDSFSLVRQDALALVGVPPDHWQPL